MRRRETTGSTTPADAEARLAAYFASYAEHGGSRSALHLLRHPAASLRAFSDLGRLPVEHVAVGQGTEGALVSAALPTASAGPRSVAATLALPATYDEYSAGSSKQTLRRKTRVAERAGVTWRAVEERAERRSLLDLANEHERNHPLVQYRKPPPENAVLLDVRLWLLAEAADGRPLHLSITPVDGHDALLGLFRTFEATDEASAARYLMTKVLAEQLIGLGVTHLWDGVHPANLPNGLRHFQRMVGFRLVRVTRKVPEAVQAGPVVAPGPRSRARRI